MNRFTEEERQALVERAAEARDISAKTRRPAPAWICRPADDLDPVALFASAAGGERFFWESPGTSERIVAAGATSTLDAVGSGRLHRVAAEAAALFARSRRPPDHFSGPLFVGGFGFSPEAPGPLWSGFPSVRFVLPEHLVTWRRGAARHVTTLLVGPGDDPAERVAAAEARWNALLGKVEGGDLPSGRKEAAPGHFTVDSDPAPHAYARSVRLALDAIRAGLFEKVVVARGCRVSRPGGFDAAQVLETLRAAHPTSFRVAVGRATATLLAATPERLLRLDGRRVRTDALAGSAPRGRSPEEDAWLGARLRESKKEQEEHAWVVQALRCALEERCEHLDVLEAPDLLRLEGIQHLHTPIEGILRDRAGTTLLDLADPVHPSPAVCGAPRESALAWLATNEGIDRGWYAGAVGWTTPDGDGELAVVAPNRPAPRRRRPSPRRSRHRGRLVSGGRARGDPPQAARRPRCADRAVSVALEAVRCENQRFAMSLLGALARAGVQHVCMCPGSRSTPLVVAAARTPGIALHVHLDERCAAFFGLGIARASRSPVALVCTSGTAAANFLPAVVEAYHARAPLVVLTADRPPELRDVGAGQTIDQVRLFGSHVRLFAEAPVPSAGIDLVRYARGLAARAVAAATGPPAGPVHLNLPFREPLEPAVDDPGEPFAQGAPGQAETFEAAAERGVLAPPAHLVESLAAELSSEPRGLIVAGPTDREPRLAAAAARLSRALGWPVLAEPISQLRSGPHVAGAPVVAHYDAFLRDPQFAADHAPGLVLRLGDTPTSKPLRQYLDADLKTRLLLVDPDGAWHDPTHRAGRTVRADAALLCDALAGAVSARRPAATTSLWRDDFLAADRACAQTFEEVLAVEPRLLPPAVVRTLAGALPDGATLFVSNSMAVRDVDTFWPASERGLRALCNRGANGIDGIVSTALGTSLASDGPTAVLTGDLAFLHDVGGLFAARQVERSCTFVVLHDDGGGIFSFLPIATLGDRVRFDDLFTLPHGIALAAAADLYGVEYVRAGDLPSLRRALGNAIGIPGIRVIEVPIDREANVAHHRALWRSVSAALGGLGAGS